MNMKTVSVVVIIKKKMICNTCNTCIWCCW